MILIRRHICLKFKPGLWREFCINLWYHLVAAVVLTHHFFYLMYFIYSLNFFFIDFDFVTLVAVLILSGPPIFHPLFCLNVY